MKKYLLLTPFILGSLTSCTLADRMNYLVNGSTEAIYQNIDAIQQSTQVIDQNAQVVDESSRTIAENHRLLEAAAKS